MGIDFKYCININNIERYRIIIKLKYDFKIKVLNLKLSFESKIMLLSIKSKYRINY